MRRKMCSNPPVVFTQLAINRLHDWFPDSNGNLEADDVMDSIIAHFGDETGTPNGLNDAENEIYEKVATMLNTGKTIFSPVLA
jgi:hypothetical protein